MKPEVTQQPCDERNLPLKPPICMGLKATALMLKKFMVGVCLKKAFTQTERQNENKHF